MDESLVETKPVISNVESSVEPIDKSVDDSKNGSEGVNEAVDTSPNVDTSEEAVAVAVAVAVALSEEKEAEQHSDEKMEVESSAVETSDEPKTATADAEPTLPAVDESEGEEANKGVEPAVEAVPEVAVKSPSEVAAVEKLSSPAPAVQSSTPPRSHSKKPKVDLTTVPVRQYLDTTVVPILLQGLSSLARERPNKPINFLANFLLEKASEYDE